MEHTLTTTGTSLAWTSAGPDDGTPIVLIQGLSAQMVSWHPGFIRTLTDRDLRVITFDNRDIGRSQKFPEGDYTITDMARDTVGLIDALGIGPVHLLGQSMGGMIAQAVAIGWPDRIKSLHLFYTAPNLSHMIGHDELEARDARPAAATRAEFIEHYVSGEELCSSTAWPQDTEWLTTLGGIMWDRCPDTSGVRRQSDAVNRSMDRTQQLSSIEVPTLIVHGRDDKLISPSASREMHDLIPDSELHIHDGMGHEFPAPLWNTFADDILATITRAASR